MTTTCANAEPGCKIVVSCPGNPVLQVLDVQDGSLVHEFRPHPSETQMQAANGMVMDRRGIAYALLFNGEYMASDRELGGAMCDSFP